MGTRQLTPGTTGKIGVIPEVRKGIKTGGWVAFCEVRRPDGSRKRIKRYRRTKTAAHDAVRAAAEVERRKWGAGGVLPTAADITDSSTVPELVRAYLDENRSDWKQRTIDQYEGTLKRYIVPALSDLAVRELTVRSANTFFRSLGPGGWKSARAVLGGAYRWAISEELIGDHNPIANSKQPPKSKPRKETVTSADFIRFRDEAKSYCVPDPTGPTRMGPERRRQWLPPMLTLALATGARVGELVAMRWEHLARVDDHGNPVEGKPWNDQHAGRLSITLQGEKGRGEDVTPRRQLLPKFAEDALVAWKKLQPDAPGGWIWPTSRGTHVATSAVSRAWLALRKSIEDRAGADALEGLPARNHVLRATSITWVANAPDGGLDMAARFAGHKQAGVTATYYVLPELVDASAILQRRWDAGAKQNVRDSFA